MKSNKTNVGAFPELSERHPFEFATMLWKEYCLVEDGHFGTEGATYDDTLFVILTEPRSGMRIPNIETSRK